MAYVPDSGDIVWIMFNPQAGRRPALVLSPKTYNSKVGLALLCPITTQVKGYPFEVLLPEGFAVKGAILSDQVKSLDWQARKAEFRCKLLPEKFNEVIKKLSTLIREQL
ncbi:type II toxin-antitoxin system PemK/MazF family toxin [Synechococcus sp. C9]|uniref:type II toxin-antitoxin system PemK/MazF family toxin n=1 Tax=Synechococcus sp. C9 TaxID=102119 RepID=UPI001FF55F10